MFVPVSKPLLGNVEGKLILEAVKSGRISGLGGAFIKEFEEKFSVFCGTKWHYSSSSCHGYLRY